MTRTTRPLAALAGTAAVLVLSGCSLSAVPAADVEKEIEDEAASTLGDGSDYSVDCPEDLEAEVGASVVCTVSVGEESFEIEAEVTEVDGNEVGFDLNEVA